MFSLQNKIVMKLVFNLYLASKSLKKLSYIRATGKCTFSTLSELPFSQKAKMIWHIEIFISKGGRESTPHNVIYVTVILQLQYQFMAKHRNSSTQFSFCVHYWRYTYRYLQLGRMNNLLKVVSVCLWSNVTDMTATACC